MSKEKLRTPDEIFIEDIAGIMESNCTVSDKIFYMNRVYCNYLNRKKGGQQMYKIVRFCFDENDENHRRIIKTGLTLEEAKEHCQREDTHEKGVWFDGFTEE